MKNHSKAIVIAIALFIAFLAGLYLGQDRAANCTVNTPIVPVVSEAKADSAVPIPTPSTKPAPVAPVVEEYDIVSKPSYDDFLKWSYPAPASDLILLGDKHDHITLDLRWIDQGFDIKNNAGIITIESVTFMSNGCEVKFKDGGRRLMHNEKTFVDLEQCYIEQNTDVYIKTEKGVYIGTLEIN